MSRLLAVFSVLGVSILTPFPPLEAFAVEPAPEVLEEVVVTATKTPVAVRQLTSAVAIIKGGELGEKKNQTVAGACGAANGAPGALPGGPRSRPQGRLPAAGSGATR